MTHFNTLRVSNIVNADGSRNVYGSMANNQHRHAGRLMPQISEEVLEASPAISQWSHPKGKVSIELQDGGSSIANFSEYWERHYHRTYPLHDNGQEV